MKTVVITVDPLMPEKEKLVLAASIIKKGGIVAFPTDTVYGLGVDIFQEDAVKNLFRVKRRALNRPVSVLVSSTEDLSALVSEVPGEARVLMESFWPGPLTIILRASDKVSRILTAGTGTVGVRIPESRIAVSLIDESGVPLTAPSANVSGHPAPSSSEDVLRELDGEIDMVIDGGTSGSKVPSTLVDLSRGRLEILREGRITRASLERAFRQ